MANLIGAVAATLAACEPGAGPVVPPDTVAEVLWLAGQLPTRQLGVLSGPAGALPTADTGAADLEGSGDGGAVPVDAGDAGAVGDAGPRQPQDLYVSGGPAGAGVPLTGREVPVPAAPALPESLALGQALRPLRVRRPDRGRWRVDEAATATRAARLSWWAPILRPVEARWPDLALLVDGAPTMEIWRDAARAMRPLVEQVGAFRELRVWRLDSGGGRPASGSEPVSIAPVDRSGLATAQPRPMLDLLPDPTGRRLVLVLTDGTDPAWGDGRYGRALARLARTNPVAVLSLVPRWYWPAGGLRTTPGEVRLDQALLPNVRWRRRGVGSSTFPPIPVADLTPSRLSRCAAALAASCQQWTTLRLLDPGRLPYPDQSGVGVREPAPTRGLAKRAEDSDPEFVVGSLRSRLSPPAFTLLRHLALVPVELHFAQLIMRDLSPPAGLPELAEVLYSQVLTPVGPSGPGQRYRFVDERVRAVLRDRASTGLREQMEWQVREFVVAHHGRVSETFEALLAEPDRADLLATAFEPQHGPFPVPPDTFPPAPSPAQRLTRVFELVGSVAPARRERARELIDRYGPAWPEPRLSVVTVGGLLAAGEGAAKWLEDAIATAADRALYVEHADWIATRPEWRRQLQRMCDRLPAAGPGLVILAYDSGARPPLTIPSGGLGPVHRVESLPWPSDVPGRWYTLLVSRLTAMGLQTSIDVEDWLWRRGNSVASLLAEVVRQLGADALHTSAVAVAAVVAERYRARLAHSDEAVEGVGVEDIPHDLGTYLAGGPSR